MEPDHSGPPGIKNGNKKDGQELLNDFKMAFINDEDSPLYSLFKARTGFADAALIASVLTVIKATPIAAIPANRKIHHCIWIW